MTFDGNSIRCYLYSDYPVDDRPLGYFTRNTDADLGRVTSALDITSQVGKAFFGTVGGVAWAAADIIVGSVSTVVSIPTAIVWKISDCAGSECIQEESVDFLIHTGISRLLRGIFTIISVIPALLWRIGMIIADALGIFCPEVGRRARIMDKIIDLTMREYIYYHSDPEREIKGVVSFQKGWSSNQADQARRAIRPVPRYSHDISVCRAHLMADVFVYSIERLRDYAPRVQGANKSFTEEFIPAAKELYKSHAQGSRMLDADAVLYNELYVPKE